MDTEDSPWGDVPSTSSSKPAQPEGESTGQDAKKESTPSAGNAKAGRHRTGPRTVRPSRRVEVQSSRLEALDDEAGPLGPLGESASGSEQPAPAPPSKEQTLPTRGGRPGVPDQGYQPPQRAGGAGDGSGLMGDAGSGAIGFGDDLEGGSTGRRVPPPVQPPPPGADNRRQGQPSMSVEQAAKPSFDISVGDPHKVGDLTSSHIVYQVRTRTTSKAYKQSEFTVTRRYRDFLWLYGALHNNNPGVVVPPPPEKQAVGRFETDFVESRRAALERMLNKVALHQILQHDSDLKIFLESDSFSADIKHREHRDIPGLSEPKSGGMFSSFGLGGSSSGSKFVEHDDWFHERRIYLDALENQLKALLKAMDAVVVQRKALGEAAGELSGSLAQLSSVELAPTLSGPLQGLSDIQMRIRELHERQAQQDVLTLGITIDEYIRLIGSVKTAFNQRQRSYAAWHTAEAELAKRRSTQDKVLRSGKTQQDRLNQLQADVAEGERRCHQARLLCEDMGRLMRGELERFEREKVEDFKSGVETFLEGAVEAQKELIEIWETYLMQFDAEDDEEPFFKPSVLQTEPIPTSKPPGQPSNTESPDAQHGSESGGVAPSHPGEANGESDGASVEHERAAAVAAAVAEADQ